MDICISGTYTENLVSKYLKLKMLCLFICTLVKICGCYSSCSHFGL